MKCPKCGTEMNITQTSEGRFAVCPSCKAKGKLASIPNTESSSKPKKKSGCLKVILIIIGIFILIGIIGTLFGGDKDSNKNPLIDAKFKKADVKSGSGESLGQYGYISIKKEQLKKITNKQLFEFANTRVSGSNLNWVSIICDDKTGICFAGSMIEIATYGDLDTDGTLLNGLGYLTLKDNEYEYSKVQKSNETPESADPTSNESVTNPESTLTMGQQNALSKSQDYLNYAAFSYSGLIKQLEYEGFSTEDATYATDNCGADWNEQAAKKAQEYLDYSSFSRAGLVEQLVYEGFTAEQAEYGVTAVGY